MDVSQEQLRAALVEGLRALIRQGTGPAGVGMGERSEYQGRTLRCNAFPKQVKNNVQGPSSERRGSATTCNSNWQQKTSQPVPNQLEERHVLCQPQRKTLLQCSMQTVYGSLSNQSLHIPIYRYTFCFLRLILYYIHIVYYTIYIYYTIYMYIYVCVSILPAGAGR